MRIRTWLFLAFLIIPVIEIGLFYVVGSQIGIWPTLTIVLVTAIVGSYLVTRQGRQTWIRIRREISAGRSPTTHLAHGAMILVAGTLLLTPGFLTDAVGLLLMVPQFRERLRGWFVDRLESRWVVVR